MAKLTNNKILVRESFIAWIKLKGWSVAEVAKLVDLKPQQVSSILNRKIEPSKNFMHRISAATGLGVEDIIETMFK